MYRVLYGRMAISSEENLFKIYLTTATFRALYICMFYPKPLLAAVVHSSESELKRFAWLVVSAT